MDNPVAVVPDVQGNTHGMLLSICIVYSHVLAPVPLQGCTEEMIYKAGIYAFSGCHGSEASVECLRMDPDNRMFFVWVCLLCSML